MFILGMKVGLHKYTVWAKYGDFCYLRYVLSAVVVINSAS